jgi:diguanylate cyclase (GGDEF)-like protein/PAS domain S-box-containing protein
MNLKVPPEALLNAFIADSNEAILCCELDGTVAIWNAAAEELYGFSASEVLGKHCSLIIPLYEIPALEALLSNPKIPPGKQPETIERLHKVGTPINLQVQRSILRGDRGAPVGLLERPTRSITRIVRTTAETHLRLLMDQMPAVFWTADPGLRITSHGGAGFRRMSLFAGNVPGKTVHETLRCKQDQETPVRQHLAALRGISSRFEYRRRKRIFDMSLEPMRNPRGEIIGCIGVALDITERKKTEQEIRYQASHDGLTGLSNYREFVDRLETEVRRAARSGRSFALLLLDMDGLKDINDRLGHLRGNRALKHLAGVIKETCRATDLAARYGGDEFGLLLIDADQQMTEHVAQRIRDGLRHEADSLPLTVSIGAAVYPEHGKTSQQLLEVADRRMYEDKKNSKARFQTAGAK